jgi:ribosomal protein S18 acetylase RimI-like enzyme
MAEEILRSTTLTSEGDATVAPTLSLRPVETPDEAWQLRIFAESHCAGFELLGLEAEVLASLIGMQFHARQTQYRAHAGATEYLICRRRSGSAASGSATADEAVLGSCWLSDTAEQLRVLDIAVLAEHRRQGVARAVLTELCTQATAAAKPLRLSVWHQNHPARELYRTLGFLPNGARDWAAEAVDLGNGYLELQFVPDRAPRLRAGAR